MPSWKRTAYGVEVVLLIASALVATAVAQPPGRKIDIEEARKLVHEVVKGHNPDASITSSPRAFDPDFYFFAATWPNPAGSPMIGYFAVNPWTGDVWNAAGCEHLTSKSIERLQQDIRKRSHFKREDYVKLREKKPMCGAD
jgi:hypothetical protein